MDDDATRPDPPDEPATADDTPTDAPDEPATADDAAPGSARRRITPARLTRRQVLTMGGAAGLVGAGVVANRFVDDHGERRTSAGSSDQAPTTAGATTRGGAGPAGARWSDPATWGGHVPGPGDVAVIDRSVVLDVDATVAGVRIEPAGELTFDSAASRRLASTGNVVVSGALRAQPDGPGLEHVVVFEGVDESRFVGDHTMEPVETDVGLWVVGDGVLDLHGAPKRAWTHLAAPADRGDATIAVVAADGWQVGDEVVVTATEPATVDGYASHHDRRTVTAVDGTAVTLDRPLDHPHPDVTVRPGVTHHAEVLNISRNVRVEGTPGGRAHVQFLAVSTPQDLSYVGLRHLGPQSARTEGGVEGTLGRYSLHFHMSDDATQGTVVEGAVAYEGGNHAFVSHLSNGVTFRDCIAHDQAEIPFWWDGAGDDEAPGSVPTDDLVYERCVAHLVHPTDASTYGVAGFLLGTGRGNVARGCVASGIQADDEAAPGFNWSPESRDEVHVWTFEDCVSHNNNGSSLYHWVNVVPRTIIDRFTAYHDRHGIRAGAYSNLVSYRDTTVYACREAGLVVVAVPDSPIDAPDETITYEGMYVDQAGLTEFAMQVTAHIVGSERPTLVTGGHFTGGTRAQVGFPEAGEYPQVYEFTDCTFDGNAFWLADPLTEIVEVTVRDDVNGAVVLRPAGRSGQFRPEWNATVTAL